MTNSKSFQVSFPIEGNRETFTVSGKQAGNFSETTSLKALANKVLQGNRKETFRKLPVSTGGNFKGQVSGVGNSVSAADMDIMKTEYAAFSKWLSERDMIDRNTTAYKRVRAAINTMDRAMVRGDVKGFLEAVRNAKYAYIEAEGGSHES